MQVYVTSPGSNVYLTVVSPSGSPLARAQAGAQSMDQTLPENGDYSLQLSVFGTTLQTSFTLNITITGGQPTQPPPTGIKPSNVARSLSALWGWQEMQFCPLKSRPPR